MRKRWVRITAAAALIMVIAAAALAGWRNLPPANYIALGDSIASGAGAGNYFEQRPGVPESCTSSRNAYPWLVTSNSTAKLSMQTYACAGEMAADVLGSGSTTTGETPQLRRIGAQTRIVTLTLGGNDYGFAQIVENCELPHTESTCLSQEDGLKAKAKNLQQTILRPLYELIRRTAPHAKLLVVGYPDFSPLDKDVSFSCPILGFGLNKIHFLRRVFKALNDAIQAATKGLDEVEFVDTWSSFDGHRLCSSDPWAHEVTIPLSGSFHPNAKGQAALANEVVKHIGPLDFAFPIAA